MTSIRKSLALGALALAAGLVVASPAQAQLGSRSGSIAGLLALGSSAKPAVVPSSGTSAIGRPPVSQPIPGPVINN